MVSSCEVLSTELWGCEGHQKVWLEAVPCSVSPLHIPTWTGVCVCVGGGGGGRRTVMAVFQKQSNHFNHVSLPDGMSTEHNGIVMVARVERMASNGARTSPWKLNPKTASTAKS